MEDHHKHLQGQVQSQSLHVHARERSYKVIFKVDAINCRDSEGLSVTRRQREVALLPGAEFAFGDIKVLRAGK